MLLNLIEFGIIPEIFLYIIIFILFVVSIPYLYNVFNILRIYNTLPKKKNLHATKNENKVHEEIVTPEIIITTVDRLIEIIVHREYKGISAWGLTLFAKKDTFLNSNDKVILIDFNKTRKRENISKILSILSEFPTKEYAPVLNLHSVMLNDILSKAIYDLEQLNLSIFVNELGFSQKCITGIPKCILQLFDKEYQTQNKLKKFEKMRINYSLVRFDLKEYITKSDNAKLKRQNLNFVEKNQIQVNTEISNRSIIDNIGRINSFIHGHSDDVKYIDTPTLEETPDTYIFISKLLGRTEIKKFNSIIDKENYFLYLFEYLSLYQRKKYRVYTKYYDYSFLILPQELVEDKTKSHLFELLTEIDLYREPSDSHLGIKRFTSNRYVQDSNIDELNLSYLIIDSFKSEQDTYLSDTNQETTINKYTKLLNDLLEYRTEMASSSINNSVYAIQNEKDNILCITKYNNKIIIFGKNVYEISRILKEKTVGFAMISNHENQCFTMINHKDKQIYFESYCLNSANSQLILKKDFGARFCINTWIPAYKKESFDLLVEDKVNLNIREIVHDKFNDAAIFEFADLVRKV